jgi:hypothetical protein
LTKVAHKLLDSCLKKGSTDNMSVLIVQLDKAGGSAGAAAAAEGKGGGGAGAGDEDEEEDFEVDGQFENPENNPMRTTGGLTRGQYTPPLRHPLFFVWNVLCSLQGTWSVSTGPHVISVVMS